MIFETFISTISWKSILDIILVAILFYQIISMLKGTRAAQVLIGLLVIFVTYVFSSLLQLETLHWIISKFYSSFIIVVIVLFQDDIRRILSRFGKGPFFTGMSLRAGSSTLEEVISAAKLLSHERIGALMVFERSIGLNKLYDHSVLLDAYVSEQLLTSIFQSFSPLHDGAVIIQKNRITCASAQLPLSKNPRFSKKLGTRHSAAVGISEETDAVVLVVSEETGHISISWEGNLQRQSSVDAAHKMLHVLLLPRGERSPASLWFEDRIIFPTKKFFFLAKSFIAGDIFFRKQDSAESHQDLMDGGIKKADSESHWPKVHVRLPKQSIVSKINSSLISTYTPKGNTLWGEEGLHPASASLDQTQMETQASTIESKLSRVDLQPEDRFDPPLPKVLSIHELSLENETPEKTSEDSEEKK